jgi:hypothetical protein
MQPGDHTLDSKRVRAGNGGIALQHPAKSHPANR